VLSFKRVSVGSSAASPDHLSVMHKFGDCSKFKLSPFKDSFAFFRDKLRESIINPATNLQLRTKLTMNVNDCMNQRQVRIMPAIAAKSRCQQAGQALEMRHAPLQMCVSQCRRFRTRPPFQTLIFSHYHGTLWDEGVSDWPNRPMSFSLLPSCQSDQRKSA